MLRSSELWLFAHFIYCAGMKLSSHRHVLHKEREKMSVECYSDRHTNTCITHIKCTKSSILFLLKAFKACFLRKLEKKNTTTCATYSPAEKDFPGRVEFQFNYRSDLSPKALNWREEVSNGHIGSRWFLEDYSYKRIWEQKFNSLHSKLVYKWCLLTKQTLHPALFVLIP